MASKNPGKVFSGIPEVTDDCPTSSATSIPVSPINCLYFKLPTGLWWPCAGSIADQQHSALNSGCYWEGQESDGLFGNHSTKWEN